MNIKRFFVGGFWLDTNNLTQIELSQSDGVYTEQEAISQAMLVWGGNTKALPIDIGKIVVCPGCDLPSCGVIPGIGGGGRCIHNGKLLYIVALCFILHRNWKFKAEIRTSDKSPEPDKVIYADNIKRLIEGIAASSAADNLEIILELSEFRRRYRKHRFKVLKEFRQNKLKHLTEKESL